MGVWKGIKWENEKNELWESFFYNKVRSKERTTMEQLVCFLSIQFLTKKKGKMFSFFFLSSLGVSFSNLNWFKFYKLIIESVSSFLIEPDNEVDND